ncbi:MAG TPA: FHA domain-containing protein [Candidatus Eremiobacteraceae bacterium]|nr:FHA domain-containing protein [Candidatus Eremiobacteraceae bacterium]
MCNACHKTQPVRRDTIFFGAGVGTAGFCTKVTTMSDRIMDIPEGFRRSPVTAFPGRSTSHGTRVCARCMAGNSSGETYCKVCGDELPAPTAEETADAAATRRIPLPPTDGELVVHEDGVGSVGCVIRLDRDVLLVGRASKLDRVFPEIDLTAADPESYVSRRHAFIVRRHGGFAVEDLDSANGTYVNGSTRVGAHVAAALKDGDRLMFGRTNCTLRLCPPIKD